MKILMGIGNEINGDDAIGVLVARRLKYLLPQDWVVIDAGIMPENYTSRIERLKPELLVMVDAIKEEGVDPGDVKLINRGSLGSLVLSTHTLPLSLLYDYLSQFVPRIIIIGIGIKDHIPYTPCTLPLDEVTEKVYKLITEIKSF